MAFRFFEPGPLVDGELELVSPEARWVDEMVAASTDPTAGRITRQQFLDFLRVAPRGRQFGDPTTGRVPAYHFWMCLHPPRTPPFPVWAMGRADAVPPMSMAGSIGLRIGHSSDIEMYLGHIGYNVFPFARGNHYAERACRLLVPLAKRHEIKTLWITCNPDNLASRRTCERLGCKLVETVPLPIDHPLRERGDRRKCRYRGRFEFKIRIPNSESNPNG